uniref:Uncharacterized protein n=1 Tax=Timema cristinae TaxID=61476 RepID=A0A7R9D6G9_TIMCR|nr:unnamed protein product [Timema cristinae]
MDVQAGVQSPSLCDDLVKAVEDQQNRGAYNEMTESEDHTSDERAHYETSNDSDTSIQHIGESISESDMDFQPNFLDKLDNFIQTFKRKTDANVRNIKDDYDLKDNELNSSIIPTITTKRKPLENIVEVEDNSGKHIVSWVSYILPNPAHGIPEDENYLWIHMDKT